MTDQDCDPFDMTPCEWPGCPAHGNPYEDPGWGWWPRKYLWPPEGFYCPKHSVVIQEGIRAGDFKDWPLDTDPEVLETLEGIAKFAPLDSAKGQRLLRKADAAMRRVNRKLKPQHNRNIAAARARAPALETAHMGGKPLKPQ